MITSYPEALKFLYDNLPMFQRLGAAAIRKDLTNTIKLCDILGNPQRKIKTIHVAGTNGKGSTCHMLASILQTGGLKTGLYTSPHLKNFTERIKINGEEVSPEYVVDFVNLIRPAIEEIHPSFFEITVAMAFDYFAKQGVDVAVIEVGLGGRLDSTNIITPLVSVITNISWDHKDLLGDTLPLIAKEKAGIIKRRVPVVISERQQEVADVFLRKATEEDAEIFFASDHYRAARSESALTLFNASDEPVLPSIRLPLHGIYQMRNLPGVIKTVDVLRQHFPFSDEMIKKGLEDTIANTGLKGRWQILRSEPTVVCDTAHNEAGIREVLLQISNCDFDRLFFVLGIVRDKDVSQILAMMPTNASYYFCQPKIPRAMDALTLQREALAFELRGEVIRDVNEAKRKAISTAAANDFVFIGGSTYVVAELDEL